MSEIINKVKESGLITIDLADFKPKNEFIEIDIADLLWQGMVLKEKDFRSWIKSHDWSQYKNNAVFVHCSVDAIIPTWAFMLVASSLSDVTDNFIIGSRIELEKKMILKNIRQLDINQFMGGKIIIKGCSDISSPEFAMSELIHLLQPVAKSLMYGEPCSTVPIFKRK